MLNWVDMAGTEMAKGFRQFRRDRHAPSLTDIRIALISLAAVVDDIQGRFPS